MMLDGRRTMLLNGQCICDGVAKLTVLKSVILGSGWIDLAQLGLAPNQKYQALLGAPKIVHCGEEFLAQPFTTSRSKPVETICY